MKKIIIRMNCVFLIVLFFTNITVFAIDKEQIIASLNAPYIDENTGYLPRPVEIRETDKPVLSVSPFLRLYGDPIIPATYDLRPSGIVSPVKSQGSSSTCWAFGALSSLESTMLKNNVGNTYDYSESHMKHALSTTNTYGFDRNANGSGNFQMVAAYLARGSGPVLEKNDVFVANDANRDTSITDSKTVEKYATKMYQLPNLPDNYTDLQRQEQITKTKEFIMEFGVVNCAYYTASSYYKTNTDSIGYYYPKTETASPNHSVSIVGWDDTYSKNNFNIAPAGDGAFLIKNSWGTSWGTQGYFWMSYYDKYVAYDVACIAEVKNAKEYDNIYQYDQFGVTSALALPQFSSLVGANKFVAKSQHEILKAVGFDTVQENVNYEIYVNENGHNLNSDTLKLVAQGSLKYAGHHTIDLQEQVLISGTDFAVAVKLTSTEDDTVFFPIETWHVNYSTKASNNPNEGFICDVIPTLQEEQEYPWWWMDVDEFPGFDPNIDKDASICIKALTDKPTSSVSFYNGNDEVITDATENDTVVSNIKVRNAGQNAKAVLAMYKDGKLENISYQSAVDNSINVFNSVFPSGSGYTFKSFLIDENTMQPLIKSGYTITK